MIPARRALAALLACLALPAGAQTLSTSEEFPPIACPRDSFVTAMGCAGWYCDTVSITCAPVRDPLSGETVQWRGGTFSTGFFSEEQGRQDCPEGHALVGLACAGWWCDAIALVCAPVSDGPLVTDCDVTRPFSEEPPSGATVESGHVVTAVTCLGSACDTKQLKTCFPF